MVLLHGTLRQVLSALSVERNVSCLLAFECHCHCQQGQSGGAAFGSNSIALLVCCRSEVFLMMRTLRDMNMSKFVAEDVPLFLSLIEDLFPGLKADRAQFPDISSALEKVGHCCHPWIASLLGLLCAGKNKLQLLKTFQKRTRRDCEPLQKKPLP